VNIRVEIIRSEEIMAEPTRRDLLKRSVLAGSWMALSSRNTESAMAEPGPDQESQDGGRADWLQVALLQMCPDGNNQEYNLAKADDFCRRAAGMGADIALMPEMWNVGYTKFEGTDPATVEAFRDQAVGRDSTYFKRFTHLARELKMAIAVTYLEKWEGPPRNSVTIIDRTGEPIMTYAKVHTCDFAAMEASCSPGDGFHVCSLDTAVGELKIGAMICYDREAPESARILMLKGAELILTPNACHLDTLRIDQFKTRAYENAVGVAMANHAAPKNNGQSCAFDVDGKLVVRAGEPEGIHLARFDLQAMRAYRRKTIWGNAYRRPHRYGMLLETGQEEVFERRNGFGEPFQASDR
jgi:predicted amidohydrolase